jgi:hypothetical protein
VSNCGKLSAFPRGCVPHFPLGAFLAGDGTNRLCGPRRFLRQPASQGWCSFRESVRGYSHLPRIRAHGCVHDAEFLNLSHLWVRREAPSARYLLLSPAGELEIPLSLGGGTAGPPKNSPWIPRSIPRPSGLHFGEVILVSILPSPKHGLRKAHRTK